MAHQKRAPGGIPLDVRAELARYRSRLRALEAAGASEKDWRLLQYQLLRAFIEGQRAFINLQSFMLVSSKAGAEIRPQRRAMSMQLFIDLGDLHELMREVDRKCNARAECRS